MRCTNSASHKSVWVQVLKKYINLGVAAVIRGKHNFEILMAYVGYKSWEKKMSMHLVKHLILDFYPVRHEEFISIKHFSTIFPDLPQWWIKHDKQTSTISKRPRYFTPINITYDSVYLSTKQHKNKPSERYYF